MHGRRWPWITVAIIVMNSAVFLATYSTIESQSSEVAQVNSHLLALARSHPELKMTEDAQRFVQSVEQNDSDYAAALRALNEGQEDSGSHRTQKSKSPVELQAEMDELCLQFSNDVETSVLWNYAYVPGAPRLISYFTSMFLHGGWLHLIFNMWFLWLAGTILEDTWGRLIYPAFYLLCGLLATTVHGMVNSGSMLPALGASGAIAGLMGAFLVRFPKTKIRMMWLAFFWRYKFEAPAFTLLPLWLGLELFSGVGKSSASDVAHWAHIGGFVAGAMLALALRASGLEKKAEQAVTAKTEWWRTAALPTPARPVPPWPR